MAPVNGQRDGLRTRCNQDALPLEQLSNQQRGVRAAKEVLQGERTLPQALQHYRVGYSTIFYYKKKLVASGLGECLEAAAAAARASEAGTSARRPRKNTAGTNGSVVMKVSLTRMLLEMPATLCRLIIVAHTYERYIISIPVRFDPGSRAQSLLW